MSLEKITPLKAVLYGHRLATLPVFILYLTTGLFIYLLIPLFINGNRLSFHSLCLWVILTIPTATPITWMLWRQRIFHWREWLQQQDVDLEQTEKLAVNTFLVWPNRWFEIKKIIADR